MDSSVPIDIRPEIRNPIFSANVSGAFEEI